MKGDAKIHDDCLDDVGESFSRDETILCLKDGFLYPAKILDMKTLEDGSAGVLVHYQGWNKKYDEWVEEKESCRKLTEENKREQKRLVEDYQRRKAMKEMGGTSNTKNTKTSSDAAAETAAAAAKEKNKKKKKNTNAVVANKKNKTTTKGGGENNAAPGKDGKKSTNNKTNKTHATKKEEKENKKKAANKSDGEQRKQNLDAAVTEVGTTKTKTKEDASAEQNSTKKQTANASGRPSKKQKGNPTSGVAGGEGEAGGGTTTAAHAQPTKGGKGAATANNDKNNKRKNATLDKGAANETSKDKKSAKKSEKDTASANARKQKQEKETEIEKQEQQQEQRQAPLKPKVKVILATTLKKELIKQYEALTHNRVLKLPREPAAHTVQSLFSDYEVEAIAKARTPKQIERAKEVVSGLKRYFDAALHKALLYEKEKKYYDVAIAKNDALKSKPASEICGAEHLLRLYVKLPDFIPVEAFVGQKGEKEAELIGHQLGETLRWLQKRSHEAFDGAYVEIDETSGKVIREIRKGTEMDDDDDEEEEQNERRREKTEGKDHAEDSFVKKDPQLPSDALEKPKNDATEPPAIIPSV